MIHELARILDSCDLKQLVCRSAGFRVGGSHRSPSNCPNGLFLFIKVGEGLVALLGQVFGEQ